MRVYQQSAGQFFQKEKSYTASNDVTNTGTRMSVVNSRLRGLGTW